MAEIIVPSEYHLDGKVFRQRPKGALIVPQYKVLSPVNRFNWTALLIRDFAEGAGDWERQNVYFEWLRLKTGFDWELSLEHFMEAGSWDVMVRKERELFLQIYTHLPHSYIEEFMADPKPKLEHQLEGVIDSEAPEFKARFNLAKMSEIQLREAMRTYL